MRRAERISPAGAVRHVSNFNLIWHPIPILTSTLSFSLDLDFSFDTHILDSVLTQLDQTPSGLYSMTVRTRIPRDQLESPTPITCAFFLLGTNYTKRRETIFYGK